MMPAADGVRFFYLAYRHQGKNRRLNLGRYPATSLQKARGRRTRRCPSWGRA
jgi:hypothetical protein